MTDEPIDLDSHRERPGTSWFSGLVCCTTCGHRHVAVSAMPSWAVAPPPLECPACGTLTSIAVGAPEAAGAWEHPDKPSSCPTPAPSIEGPCQAALAVEREIYAIRNVTGLFVEFARDLHGRLAAEADHYERPKSEWVDAWVQLHAISGDRTHTVLLACHRIAVHSEQTLAFVVTALRDAVCGFFGGVPELRIDWDRVGDIYVVECHGKTWQIEQTTRAIRDAWIEIGQHVAGSR